MSIVCTFVSGIAAGRSKVGMTSSAVGTLRSARKSVLGSIVAGSIPRYLSTAGVATKSCAAGR